MPTPTASIDAMRCWTSTKSWSRILSSSDIPPARDSDPPAFDETPPRTFLSRWRDSSIFWTAAKTSDTLRRYWKKYFIFMKRNNSSILGKCTDNQNRCCTFFLDLNLSSVNTNRLKCLLENWGKLKSYWQLNKVGTGFMSNFPKIILTEKKETWSQILENIWTSHLLITSAGVTTFE